MGGHGEGGGTRVLPVQDVPVAELLLGGVGGSVVVQVDEPREEMLHHLRSHDCREKQREMVGPRWGAPRGEEGAGGSPPSLKSLVMCLLGRDRGIWSIQAYRACSSSSVRSRSITTLGPGPLKTRVRVDVKESRCWLGWGGLRVFTCVARRPPGKGPIRKSFIRSLRGPKGSPHIKGPCSFRTLISPTTIVHQNVLL